MYVVQDKWSVPEACCRPEFPGKINCFLSLGDSVTRSIGLFTAVYVCQQGVGHDLDIFESDTDQYQFQAYVFLTFSRLQHEVQNT